MRLYKDKNPAAAGQSWSAAGERLLWRQAGTVESRLRHHLTSRGKGIRAGAPARTGDELSAILVLIHTQSAMNVSYFFFKLAPPLAQHHPLNACFCGNPEGDCADTTFV